MTAPATAPAATSATVTPVARCVSVRKRYGSQQAVDDVSFDVGRGEIVGLLGPNGAGKSSVIKIMLGLVAADGGHVSLFGRPCRDPNARTRVGYLPELFRYQPWLTADEVLTLHVRLAEATTNRAARDECLSRVGLDRRGGDRVGGFSKGMQQRLGLAVALVGRPDLVVLDEPTSALDPVGRADVRDIVTELRANGTSVLLNSHLIGEVERVCDRVVILDRGRVIAAGSLDELLGHRQVHLHLTEVGADARERLGATGDPTGDPSGGPDRFTVPVPVGHESAAVADLVRDLVALGVRVHAVEPSRMSLEDRLLTLLRDNETTDA